MRVMLLWQSAHTLLPTKCAPSICGGSTTVRSSVEHELKSTTLRPTTANATAETNHRQFFIGKWIFRKRPVTEKLAFLSRRHLTKARRSFKLQLRLEPFCWSTILTGSVPHAVFVSTQNGSLVCVRGCAFRADGGFGDVAARRRHPAF